MRSRLPTHKPITCQGWTGNASKNISDGSPNSMSTQETMLTRQQISSNPSLGAPTSGSIQLPKSGIGEPLFKARNDTENNFSSFRREKPYLETEAFSGSSEIART
ncbi:unnamed protein product [Lepeophtheirus salmonis]|uniref:(salmon louse) hypothetical protein n=1 Tax=Lepeophtheirus salmonis TaxID=72036 RepID=A0A7R8H9I3_LEPSM|nr:unnamed protein product [Lepeophtheirus salmonis]CAF2956473.1 unnamed protein product [Lepeophtheirus salmonis]